jgi:hypothetical protein
MQNANEPQDSRVPAVVVGAIALVVVVFIGLLALPEVTTRVFGLGPEVDAIGYGVMTGALTVAYISSYIAYYFVNAPVPQSLESRVADLTGGVLYVPFFAILYGEFLRSLNMMFGGFSAHTTSFWDWAVFGVYWVIDTFAFNTTEIFDWKLTNIHAIAPWAEVLVVGLNVMLAVFVVGLLALAFQRTLRRRQKSAIIDSTRED